MDQGLATLSTPAPTSEERNWAMAAHLSALIAIVGFPFGHVIGPLVVYLAKGNESPFVGGHARASINYQLTVTLGAIVVVIVGLALFAGLVGFAAMTSPHGSDSDAGTAVGVGVMALWGCAIFAVLVFVVLSVIFIIMGTIAASEGRPYVYPFAFKFLR